MQRDKCRAVSEFGLWAGLGAGLYHWERFFSIAGQVAIFHRAHQSCGADLGEKGARHQTTTGRARREARALDPRLYQLTKQAKISATGPDLSIQGARYKVGFQQAFSVKI